MTGDRRPEHASGPHEHGHSLYEAGEFLDAPPEEAIPEREVSLRDRVLNWRTIGSIVFGVALVFLLFRFVLNLDFADTWQRITHANPLLLLVAFVLYYLTFPLRGYRWAFILGRVGTQVARSAMPPRSSSSPGSSTAWCRPSWATCTGPGC